MNRPKNLTYFQSNTYKLAEKVVSLYFIRENRKNY